MAAVSTAVSARAIATWPAVATGSLVIWGCRGWGIATSCRRGTAAAVWGTTICGWSWAAVIVRARGCTTVRRGSCGSWGIAASTTSWVSLRCRGSVAVLLWRVGWHVPGHGRAIAPRVAGVATVSWGTVSASSVRHGGVPSSVWRAIVSAAVATVVPATVPAVVATAVTATTTPVYAWLSALDLDSLLVDAMWLAQDTLYNTLRNNKVRRAHIMTVSKGG